MIKKIPVFFLILSLILGQSFKGHNEVAAVSVPQNYTGPSINNVNFYEEKRLDPANTKLLILWSLTAMTAGLILLETGTKTKKTKKINRSVIVPIKDVDYRLLNRL